MKEYLIVCPLVFCAGLMDAVAGGGGLISLPAYLMAGLPPHMALGTNKLGSAMGTTISTARFIKNGYVKGRLAAGAAMFALLGSFAGARIALLISENIIRNIMFFILPLTAWYVLRNRNMVRSTQAAGELSRSNLIIVMAASLMLGMYDGFYGPGTGTFLLLVFTGAANMRLTDASGLTKVVNLSSNVAALTSFILNGKVIYPLGLAAGMFCIAGHYIGSGLVVDNGYKVVRPVVLGVLLLLFVKILVEGTGMILL